MFSKSNSLIEHHRVDIEVMANFMNPDMIKHEYPAYFFHYPPAAYEVSWRAGQDRRDSSQEA